VAGLRARDGRRGAPDFGLERGLRERRGALLPVRLHPARVVAVELALEIDVATIAIIHRGRGGGMVVVIVVVVEGRERAVHEWAGL
jgi:hypothetical protein